MANMNVIRDLCHDNNMTLLELSSRLSISPHGLQRIFRENSTKIETLEKIAEIFDVPITVFFQDIRKSDFEIFQFRNNNLLKVLSVRYESILDRISFLLDSYIWEFIQIINNKKSPLYPFKHPDRPRVFILDINDELLNIFTYSHSLPFSKWSKEDQKVLRKYNYIFEGFYFSLFRLNIFNIVNYLPDGFIQDSELQKHWETWKIIREEIVNDIWKY
jgi:transcriptional regulator with XRE-family HTH domain